MHEQENKLDRENIALAGSTEPTETVSNPSRRRFNRAGLGASGVILTLACKPVLGGVVSKAPSGFLSANQSTHGAAAQTSFSSARQPEYWQDATNWPVPPKTKFSHVFSCNSGSPFVALTLGELIASHPSDTTRIGKYLSAAMLNSRSGWTPFLREDTIQAMYIEWRTKGYFSPTANVRWGAADIVNYLRATQA